MTNNEIWKDIKNYEGKYQISNLGKVRSIDYKNTGTIKELTLRPINTGYLTCHLRKNGKQQQLLVHRVVAEMFLDNKDNLAEVNHINENKLDNRVENLEWCTSKYNCNYGSHIDNIKNSFKNKKLTKVFDVYDKNKDIVIKRYYSIMDCVRELKLNASLISKSIKSKKEYNGYYFMEVTNE